MVPVSPLFGKTRSSLTCKSSLFKRPRSGSQSDISALGPCSTLALLKRKSALSHRCPEGRPGDDGLWPGPAPAPAQPAEEQAAAPGTLGQVSALGHGDMCTTLFIGWGALGCPKKRGNQMRLTEKSEAESRKALLKPQIAC